ncbi:helix-turn-helix domain-containing protein [Lacticaseibacillus sharpeae]|uniref:Mga helix-turn-helix domain-containing protein n=1 Tax=Lacticaseibacillus sharpeae JCM 1186 = DSM 20505 TaxID=1291052 RepID=A0A0R1ZNX6_9LACO|nr:helix-turn-helix domain-containing protein [Lacticaseibacillus sharpeae]KRM54852.1 hypothetical protein FC18_GL002270 [Lacticaseibacillus sharpeae JCM 1186 = DSM 20505]
MFEAYFFDKHADTVFRLFKLLKSLNGAPFTINKLSKQLEMSYQQTYNAYQDVMVDLRQIQTENAHQQTQAVQTGVMNSALEAAPDADLVVTELSSVAPDYLAAKTDAAAEPATEMSFIDVAQNIHVDNYRFYLLNHSITFRFFDQVFQNDGIDAAAFCRENGISMSTLRRRIEPFRNFLQNNRIQIDPGTWELHGGELVIRHLLVFFYDEGYRGAGWPFHCIDHDQILQQFSVINAPANQTLGIEHLSVITKRNMLTLGVQMLRIKQGHYFAMNPRLQLLLRNFGDLADLVFTETYLPDCDERTRHAERNFYYCSRIGQIVMSTEDTPTSRQLREYLHSFSNPVDSFVTALFANLTTGLDHPEELHLRADKVLLTNLYKVAFLYYIMDGTFVKPSDFADTTDLFASAHELIDQIDTFIAQIPKADETHLFSRYQPDLVKSIFTVLIPDLADFHTAPRLNVKLEMEAQSFITKDMLNFLKDSSVIRIMNSDTQEVPDLIITSVPNITGMYDNMNGHDSVDSGVPTFYWGSDNHDQDLYNLLKQLTMKAHAKAAAAPPQF